MKVLKIKVNGMVCKGCENRVKNALLDIDEVEGVEANYENGNVIITLNKDINESVIEEKINDIGFEYVKE